MGAMSDQETTTSPAIPKAEVRRVTEEIAGQLGETEGQALSRIARIIKRLGPARAEAFLQEARQVEAAGGLLVQDGSRRRTLGGVFFRLVREQVPVADRQAIWPYTAPKSPPPPPMDWDERLEIVPDLVKETGKGGSVKITLIGRPGRIVEKGEVVLTSMQQGDKTPSLPKGLPPVPAEPTVYIVYIARKQWLKVAKAIKNPEDVLIVEGLPVLDKRLGTVAVFTQSVTTKLLQAAKREAQKAEQAA
jgi:hypothetical protein